ncbi:MAG: hypothetical protein ACRDTX_21355, partial [Pseudonocardiaceae bacterium]
PEPAHPRRHSGTHPAHTPKTTTKRSQTRTEDHLMLLLAESGLKAMPWFRLTSGGFDADNSGGVADTRSLF